ncbi:unnamed protein product [Closterium sp. NIES-65]|nr:unnamed protein product [Closterium sp. NIES-65]
MLAGAAGEAVSGGTQPGRGTLVRGERSFERSGQQEGGNAGEEAVEEDARAWSRQQVVRRTLRAGNGERGETWRSECRDGSAMAAVALGTYIYDYLFPITSSNIPMRPFEVIPPTPSCSKGSLHSFEVFPHSMPSSASLVQFHIALFLLLLSLFLLSLFLLSFPSLFFPPLFFPPIPSPPIPTKAHPFNGMWDPSLLSHPLLSPARALPLCKSL